ncbi:MAG TPA: class I SAM-dependent methyltransferase [Xanthobacteraceae bacterium]|nr:class I SAM-dependent methyltransferase [Xanthobacteraceae bacterium]
MSTLQKQSHWQSVYETKGERDVSWFQEIPIISLDLIHATGVNADASIIDIGGGASRLVDALVTDGFRSVTVLDLSEKALATSRSRLGPRGQHVTWIVADAMALRPDRNYDLWHDRAAFHFLIDPSDRAAYAASVRHAVSPGGHVIIGTFAPDGPERCSGLPVARHDAASVGKVLGPSFTLIESRRDDHRTPGGNIQQFQFSRFQRQPASRRKRT